MMPVNNVLACELRGYASVSSDLAHVGDIERLAIGQLCPDGRREHAFRVTAHNMW